MTITTRKPVKKDELLMICLHDAKTTLLEANRYFNEKSNIGKNKEVSQECKNALWAAAIMAYCRGCGIVERGKKANFSSCKDILDFIDSLSQNHITHTGCHINNFLFSYRNQAIAHDSQLVTNSFKVKRTKTRSGNATCEIKQSIKICLSGTNDGRLELYMEYIKIIIAEIDRHIKHHTDILNVKYAKMNDKEFKKLRSEGLAYKLAAINGKPSTNTLELQLSIFNPNYNFETHKPNNRRNKPSKQNGN